jgi:hypothetical protein
MNLETFVGLPSPGTVVDGPLPPVREWRWTSLMFSYAPNLGMITEYDPESDAETELITTAHVKFERTFYGREEIEGQGLAKMIVNWSLDESCINPSDVIVPVNVCGEAVELPVFKLGEESDYLRLHVRVDAELNAASWGDQPGKNSVGGWASGWGITQRVSGDAAEVPEPAAAFCVGVGIVAFVAMHAVSRRHGPI